MGRLYEDFKEGETFAHEPGRTITEADNVFFCAITMNNQPLHLDAEFSKATPFGRPVVNGLLTFSLAVGISVPDLTAGTLIANLGYEDVRHPAPVFPGDTIRVKSEVLNKRLTSKPGRGLVTFATTVTNQRDEVVCTFQRTALLRTRDPDAVKG